MSERNYYSYPELTINTTAFIPYTMNCNCKDRSKPRPDPVIGTGITRGACSKRAKELTRNCRKGEGTGQVNFHQAIAKVKGRLDQTFRSIEGGLHDVEKGVNMEVADVLAKVLEFEESMKPKLLIPYKRCKELERLITPAISTMPKRSVSARTRPSQRKEQIKDRCNSAKRQRAIEPSVASTLGRDRFRELMYSPSLDRVNPWEGEEKWRASDDHKLSGSREDSSSYSSRNCGNDEDVDKTMRELQSISMSVNKSLKRINDKFIKAEGRQNLDRAVEADPKMIRKVNESLAHIGAGAKLLKRLLEEENRPRKC